MWAWAFSILLALTAPLPAQERRIEVVIEGNQQGLDAWVQAFRGRALAGKYSASARPRAKVISSRASEIQ